jgi:hypothetical protein
MTATQAIRFEIEPSLNLYELSGTVEFNHLSQKQGLWVLQYVQGFLDSGTFNSLKATQAVYECKNEETARILGYQLKANSKINAVLNRFFGDSPEQSFLK